MRSATGVPPVESGPRSSRPRGTRRRRPSRGGLLAVAAVLAVAAMTAAGCGGGSGGDGGEKGTRTTTPEERIVPDSQVTAGIATLEEQAGRVESLVATDPAAAEKVAADAQEHWLTFEGTVKKNETDMYLRFEDALSDLNLGAQKGSVEQVKRGATDLRQVAADYLAARP